MHAASSHSSRRWCSKGAYSAFGEKRRTSGSCGEKYIANLLGLAIPVHQINKILRRLIETIVIRIFYF